MDPPSYEFAAVEMDPAVVLKLEADDEYPPLYDDKDAASKIKVENGDRVEGGVTTSAVEVVTKREPECDGDEGQSAYQERKRKLENDGQSASVKVEEEELDERAGNGEKLEEEKSLKKIKKINVQPDGNASSSDSISSNAIVKIEQSEDENEDDEEYEEGEDESDGDDDDEEDVDAVSDSEDGENEDQQEMQKCTKCGEIVSERQRLEVREAKSRSSRKRSHPLPSRLTERHFIGKIPSNPQKSKPTRRCVVCTAKKTRKESRYACKQCDVALCVEPCFEVYHTKEYYK